MNREQQSQIDDLIGRYYAAFDNRSNRAICVDALRRIFMTDARVTRVAAGQVDSWTVEQFIAPRAAMLTDGTLLDFHEWEIIVPARIDTHRLEHAIVHGREPESVNWPDCRRPYPYYW